jgi:hypothetical protein
LTNPVASRLVANRRRQLVASHSAVNVRTPFRVLDVMEKGRLPKAPL